MYSFAKDTKDLSTAGAATMTSTTEVPQAPSKKTFSTQWTRGVNVLQAPIRHGIHILTRASAQHPKRTICIVVALSIALFCLGLFTNFSVDVDENVLWTPMGSHPIRQMHWIEDDSAYPNPARNMALIFHKDGATDQALLGATQVKQVFQALDLIRTLPDYKAICALWPTETHDCAIYGITKFWNHSVNVLESQLLNGTSDEQDSVVIDTMSQRIFPDDSTPVSESDVFGNARRDANGRLTSVQTFIVTIQFPALDDKDNTTVANFEEQALDVILNLQEEWAADPQNNLQVEVFAERSFADEFERAIIKDIPLVPIVFIIMGLFTSAIFFKRDRVRSRSLFGFTAVISIMLSIMTGYGLLFVCAIPFTSMTQILPFVFFGVGLDDAFIITGSYFRLDRSIDAIERVRITMDEIGMSIFLTTLTSAVAMALGCTSSIPAVYWLCLYAVPTTVLILLYQLTFFVACLILDERRVEANHRDCLRCVQCASSNANVDRTNKHTDTTSTEDTGTAAVQAHNGEDAIEHAVDKWMGQYAEVLLVPWVKVLVLLCFTAITVACSISTSQLTQAFSFTDVLPGDSYITPFFRALVDYNERSAVNPEAYFRNVDQSDPAIQQQMENYINELVEIDAILYQPQFFWLRDFKAFVAASSSNGTSTMDSAGAASNNTSTTAMTSDLSTLDFSSQLDAFLANPVFYQLYHDHIVRNNQTGAITTSRCVLTMDNIDQEQVKELVKALNDQRAVSDRQDINQDTKGEYKFFTYEGNYNIWQFYAQSANEVISNTVTSIAAMTGIALLLMPHWSAACFVFPLIVILYIDLMGVMQWAGISINPVSYIALVMSIGLLVDFVIHVLLRFYESPGNRHEKTVNLLKTMGSSILIGAITTFLGTLPLAFSTSDIFYTIFIAFLALVVLGATHGLILLPVVLSMVGPEVEIPAGFLPEKGRDNKGAAGTSKAVDGVNGRGGSHNFDDGLDDLESVHG